MRRTLVFLAVLAGSLASVGSAGAATWLVVVAGLGGDDELSSRFHDAALELRQVALAGGVDAERVLVLTEDPERAPGQIHARSTREAVLDAIARVGSRSQSGDDVWMVLIGHGSVRDGRARINLPGPDLDDAELAAALTGLADRRLVFVNTTSSSGGFVETLSAEQRVVITATKSAAQRNQPLFLEPFVAALQGTEADADRDGRVSALEAFHYARREVERHYENEKLLRTEHALLDDDGDGEGSLDPAVLGGEGATDGLLAARIFLAESSAGPAVPAGMEELAAERAELQQALDELRRQKGSLDDAVYQQELERLLLEIARLDLRLREGGGGDDGDAAADDAASGSEDGP